MTKKRRREKAGPNEEKSPRQAEAVAGSDNDSRRQAEPVVENGSHEVLGGGRMAYVLVATYSCFRNAPG